MTAATLKAQGRLITDIHEGYTRYAMADDGRDRIDKQKKKECPIF